MALPLIPLIIAAAVGLGITVLVIVYWDEIIDWFQARNDIKDADKDNIAFTLQERLKDGKFKVVQGIFNKRTNALPEGRVLQADKLDEKLARAHREEDLVVYE